MLTRSVGSLREDLGPASARLDEVFDLLLVQAGADYLIWVGLVRQSSYMGDYEPQIPL